MPPLIWPIHLKRSELVKFHFSVLCRWFNGSLFQLEAVSVLSQWGGDLHIKDNTHSRQQKRGGETILQWNRYDIVKINWLSGKCNHYGELVLFCALPCCSCKFLMLIILSFYHAISIINSFGRSFYWWRFYQYMQDKSALISIRVSQDAVLYPILDCQKTAKNQVHHKINFATMWQLA